MKEPTESVSVLQDALARDPAAWRKLVDAHSGFIYRVARRTGLSSEDAADVTQLVWVALLEGGEAIREPRALRRWLATIAHREAIRRRNLNRQLITASPSGVSENLEDETPTVEELLQREQDVERVRRGLRKLTSGCQKLLEALFAEENPSYEIVSRRLGIPVGSIGPTRARCIARLYRILRRSVP